MCSAISVRDSASCTKGSAACVLCARARTTRLCSPPTAVPAVSVSIPSRRSRSIISFPARPSSPFGTAGCNLVCRFCQNWDISKSREIDTLADAASPQTIARAAQELGCRSVAFTYNDPVIFHGIRHRRGPGLPRSGHQFRGRHRRLHQRRTAARTSTATWTPPMSISKASPKRSTKNCAPDSLAAGPGDAAVCEARDERLVGDHQLCSFPARMIPKQNWKR